MITLDMYGHQWERLPDGTERKWYPDGMLAWERLPDGTEREWWQDGTLWREKASGE